MSKEQFFNEAFDEATFTKLDLYKNYLQEWLAVFVARKEILYPNINLFDFFAGEGKDSKGNLGSPLIALEVIEAYRDYIENKNIQVQLFLNEKDTKKTEVLKENIEPFQTATYFKVGIEQMEFKEAFDYYYPLMDKPKTANLIFIDQFGIKEVTEEIFLQLTQLKQTDFIFFISSSYFKRFGGEEAFKNFIVLPDIEDVKYNNIHRKVKDYYKSLIPSNKTYYIGSFSLKKKQNIYGLIFGSGHPYGMEKFLKQAWKQDKDRGEANFDIDKENLTEGQIDLFSGKEKVAKKLELFEEDLENKILHQEISTDKEAYLYGLSSGFTPKHVKDILQKLIQAKKIDKDIALISADVHKIKEKKVKLLK